MLLSLLAASPPHPLAPQPLTCLRQVGLPEGLCWAPVDALCNSCSWDWSLRKRGAAGSQDPRLNATPPPLGRFLGVDLGTWPSLAGRGLTHVNKLSSKFRIRA